MIICNLKHFTYYKDEIIKNQKIKLPKGFISINQSNLNKNDTQINYLIEFAELVLNDSTALIYKNDTDENQISYFLYNNIGLMKPFFTRVRGKCPLSTLLRVSKSNFEYESIDGLRAAVAAFSDKELYLCLLKYLQEHVDSQNIVLEYVLSTNVKLLTYLQGADYSPKIKEQLWQLYISSNLYKKEGVSIKQLLLSFINSYSKRFDEKNFEYPIN